MRFEPSWRTELKQLTEQLSETLREYLELCGLGSDCPRCCANTRMYHDLNVYGDIAEACMETLKDKYGVDMSSFDFDQFFPQEFPGRNRFVALLLQLLPEAVRNRGVYRPLTLKMIEKVIEARRWDAVAQQ